MTTSPASANPLLRRHQGPSRLAIGLAAVVPLLLFGAGTAPTYADDMNPPPPPPTDVSTYPPVLYPPPRGVMDGTSMYPPGLLLPVTPPEAIQGPPTPIVVDPNTPIMVIGPNGEPIRLDVLRGMLSEGSDLGPPPD
jgi:hypothetical protein